MKVWHQKFTQGSTSGEDERSKALKQLTAAYDVFLECQGNLEEGAKVRSKKRIVLFYDYMFELTVF